MAGRNAEILTDYILGIGLPLSSKLEELFEMEVRPVIEAAVTSHDRMTLKDMWVPVHHARTGTTHRHFQNGKITLGKKRICSMLLRKLRGLECIAVGRYDFLGKVGPPRLIEPRRWDSLIVTWGSNTVTDDVVVLRDVHVAVTERLGELQRRDLGVLLYNMSNSRVGASRTKGGRPAHQRAMVVEWIRERREAKGMPEKEEAGRAQALDQFRVQIEREEISEQTVRRTVKDYYDGKLELGS